MATFRDAQHFIATTPQMIAHRGASRDYPEHSAKAYRHAYARGYRAMEIAVSVSAVENAPEGQLGGGTLFLMHDWSLDRTSGTTGMVAPRTPWSVIAQQTILPGANAQPDAVPEPYLTLDAYLDEFGETCIHFIDFKSLSTADAQRAIDNVKARGLMHRVVGKTVYGDPGTYGPNIAFTNMWKAEGVPTWGAFYNSNEPDFATLSAQHDLVGLEWNSTMWPQLRAASGNKPKIAHILTTAAHVSTATNNGATGYMINSPSTLLAIPPEEETDPGEAPESNQPWARMYVGASMISAAYIGSQRLL